MFKILSCSLAIFLPFCGFANADFEIKSTTATRSIDHFAGKYRGLGPSDESPLAIGEYVLNFSSNRLDSEVATGSEVLKQRSIVRFRPMSKDQLTKKVNPDYADKYWDSTTSFSTDGECPCHIFNKNPDKQTPALIVLYPPKSLVGAAASMTLGTSALSFHNEAQTQDPEGLWQKILVETSGQLPLVEHRGYPSQNFDSSSGTGAPRVEGQATAR